MNMNFYLDIWKPVLDLSSYSYRTVRTNPVLRGSENYDKKDYFGYIMTMNFLDIWKPDLDLSSLSNESGTTRQCKLQQTNKWFYVITCPKLFGYSYSVGMDKSGKLRGSKITTNK